MISNIIEASLMLMIPIGIGVVIGVAAMALAFSLISCEYTEDGKGQDEKGETKW